MGEANGEGRTVELWRAGGNLPGRAAVLARRAEDDGFDGMSFGDTQCVSNDPFVSLGVAATATTRLKLGVGVTNPVTRLPAIAASAIASVHAESGGRAVLGVGRGDSATAQLGMRRATVGQLDAFLRAVQGYLAGEVVDIDGHESTLRWWDGRSWPKVPVDVAATGPAVIAVGARLAERVTFNVGGDRDRMRWAIATARRARDQVGGSQETLSLGAYLNVVPHRDPRVSLELVKGPLAVYARFSGMSGASTEAMSERDASLAKALDERYDNARHARTDASHVELLDDDFVERFGVVGTPEHCIEKLAGLVALGLDRIAMVGPGRECDPDLVAESRQLLVDVVLPGVRAAVRSAR